MRRFLLIFMTGLLAANANGQQPLTYTQYGQVLTPLNQAASLIRPEGGVDLVWRQQWVGVEGAPRSVWMAAHAPLRAVRGTVGLVAQQAELGVEQENRVSAYLSSGIRISDREYMGVSMSVGYSQYRGSFSGLDPGDPAFRYDLREGTATVGLGLMLYDPQRYYLGISMPRYSFDNPAGANNGVDYSFGNTYHLMGGMLLALDDNFALKPSFLLTSTKGQQLQAEASATVYAGGRVGLGLNARTTGDLAGMLQVHFQRLRLGYSYGFNPGNRPLNQRINNATHEVAIGFAFGSDGFGML